MFDLTNPDNRVEYDLYFSSSNDVALDFLTDFARIDNMFDSKVLFTPHYKFTECFDCDEAFQRNCLGMGKYCAHDKTNQKMSGREIIYEDVRQICIYNLYYETNKRIWWDYIRTVHELCYGSISFKCSEDAHRELGIDMKKTQECFSQSFNMDVMASNYHHDKDLTNVLID